MKDPEPGSGKNNCLALFAAHNILCTRVPQRGAPGTTQGTTLKKYSWYQKKTGLFFITTRKLPAKNAAYLMAQTGISLLNIVPPQADSSTLDH